MANFTYSISRGNGVSLLEFSFDGNLEPSELSSIKLPDPVEEEIAQTCVIISGRGPVWLYGFIIHHLHPCKAVATFDPRLGGGVVVATHSNDFGIGDVVIYK